MHKLGILFLIIVCVQASISLAEFHQKWNAGSKKVKQSKKDWIREFGENMDHSQMSNEEITEMMMKKMRMKMKRMLQPLRDLFVKVLDLGPRQMVKGRPAFCGNYACPEFKVLNKSKHYELRMYQPSQWVSTSTQGKMKNAKVVSTCFWRLFKYIQGKNELKQKIEMTAPVITLLKSDPTSKVKNFTMSFYLPPTITNPPSPNDNALFIEKKRLKVYAHGFDGYAIREKSWKKHAMMLKKMLKKAGLKGKYYPHDKMYITAVYDDPMKLFNRHNEVWFIAKED